MSLPESKQDASLANNYESRPGVSDATPSGISSSNNPQKLSTSVKNSLDTVAESSPSTRSVSAKLPSAQGAADAVRSGVSSLLAGVSSLAVGVNDTVAQNASAPHPESEHARKADDLHIPGAFEDETSDTEDIAAVKQGVKSAYNTLPSTKDVKNSLPVTEAISKQFPSNLLTSVTNQSQGDQGTSHAADSLDADSRQRPIHKDGISRIKEQTLSQSVDSVGGNSQQGRIHQDGIGHIKQLLQSQHIASVGSNSTTSHLAGQVPLEPRGVAHIVSDNQRKAGISPEATANVEAVQEKIALEHELRRKVLESETDSAGSTATTAGLDRGIPQVVVDSQKKADASPEASANAEAVREKQEVERELRSEIPQPNSTDHPGNTSVNIGQAVSGSLASASAATVGAATYARQKTQEAIGTDPVAALPQSAREAIDGKGTSSIASYRVAKDQSDGRSLTKSLAAGASAASSAAVSNASYAREKTEQATGTDPAFVLPKSVQQSIDEKDSSDSSTSHSQTSSSPRFPGTTKPVASSSSEGVDLHSGVHNGVVGDHLDDNSAASHRTSSGSHSGHWQPGTSATVAHVPSLRNVDLSAGVKNTVVGSGAESGANPSE